MWLPLHSSAERASAVQAPPPLQWSATDCAMITPKPYSHQCLIRLKFVSRVYVSCEAKNYALRWHLDPAVTAGFCKLAQRRVLYSVLHTVLQTSRENGQRQRDRERKSEGERERERETDRERLRERGRQRERQRERESETERETEK